MYKKDLAEAYPQIYRLVEGMENLPERKKEILLAYCEGMAAATVQLTGKEEK